MSGRGQSKLKLSENENECKPLPHVHGTLEPEPRVKSSGALSGWTHSFSRSARPFSAHHSCRLLVAGLPGGLHFGHPPDLAMQVRLAMRAFHPCPHSPQVQGTFEADVRANSCGALSGCAHSSSRSARSFSAHHSCRLLVAGLPRGLHLGHPLGFLRARLPMRASHPCPHSPHVHGTFEADARMKSCGALSGCAHSSNRSARPFSAHHSCRLLVAGLPRGLHLGQPLGLLMQARLPMRVSYLWPHSRGLHSFSLQLNVSAF